MRTEDGRIHGRKVAVTPPFLVNGLGFNLSDAPRPGRNKRCTKFESNAFPDGKLWAIGWELRHELPWGRSGQWAEKKAR